MSIDRIRCQRSSVEAMKVQRIIKETDTQECLSHLLPTVQGIQRNVPEYTHTVQHTRRPATLHTRL